MELVKDSKFYLEAIKENKELLEHNDKIFRILEGDLLTLLRAKLAGQLQGNSAHYAMQRAAPVNVLKKIIDKLSTLYIEPPKRTTENPADQELIDWYVHELNINTHWNDANESFNAYKMMALDLYEHDGYLKTRSMRSGRYLALSRDSVDPMRVTDFIKVMTDENGDPKYWITTDEGFISLDKEGKEVKKDTMDNMGLNPYGVIPSVYGSRSRYLLTPYPDTDTLSMSLLIAVLLTDLNFASMFLSNPIVWTTNAVVENLQLSPNTYWDLKGIEEGEKPEIGVLKPEPNIDAQLTLIKDQLGMWLQSRNIKAGAIGKLTAETAASGISLMIQEMDTTEDRMNQITYFKEFEQDYWYRLAVMHNHLADNADFVMKKKFSDPENLKVKVEYSDQKIFESETEKVDRIVKLVDAGLLSKRRALLDLIPGIGETEVDEILGELQSSEAITITTQTEGINA